MKDEIKIITLGDIFENIETDEKAFRFKDYIKDMQEENQRLKNVLNELEEWLKSFSNDEFNYNFMVVRIQDILDKLKELKESDK